MVEDTGVPAECDDSPVALAMPWKILVRHEIARVAIRIGKVARGGVRRLRRNELVCDAHLQIGVLEGVDMTERARLAFALADRRD